MERVEVAGLFKVEGPATAATLGTDLMVEVWNERVKAMLGLAARLLALQE